MVVYVVGWYDYEERKSTDRIQDRRYLSSFEGAMAVVREQVRTWLCMWGKMEYENLQEMDNTALKAAIDAALPDNNVPWTDADIPTTIPFGSWGAYREYLYDVCDDGNEIGFITKLVTTE